MPRGIRAETLGSLATAVESVKIGHRTRVGVDGPPGAGKTTLADELAGVLRTRRRVGRVPALNRVLPVTVNIRIATIHLSGARIV